MKRVASYKFDSVVIVSRLRSLHLIISLCFVYILLMSSQLQILVRYPNIKNDPPTRRFITEITQTPCTTEILSHLNFTQTPFDNSSIYHTSMQAWKLGSILWTNAEKAHEVSPAMGPEPEELRCPQKVYVNKGEFNRVVRFPCGLKVGSQLRVVGKPKRAHEEEETSITLEKDVMVSQFVVELRREKEGAKLLHFNPRISGDWSGMQVIEMNHCYRGQWGSPVRCQGWPSAFTTQETVDGQVKCEEWISYDDNDFEELKANLWSGRLKRRRKKVELDWPSFPFSEEMLFVLTITLGVEGYHISVNGKHISSFAYRNGFDLEDDLTLDMHGDVDVHSIFAASLPLLHPSIASERHLDMSSKWKARPLPDEPIHLFIGVISAGDHFAERMAVRKSWMQHYLVESSNVVVRFFVALHERETINMELRKEAKYFGDIVIVPYLDNYGLVVLKTLAICEYGVNMLTAKYIMKCDDDTFVRVEAVLEEVQDDSGMSIYAGKMNYYHEPLRSGKWAVTYEEWPDKIYPPYADGPGYIISSDIARFIITKFQKNKLRLFKMEDVSMGLWVEQFSITKSVEYLHNSRFYQAGCIDDYLTAHYQSPKQLICLWERLKSDGKAICCDL